MLQKLRKQQTGFTIIEVMIVLVIAAVILLIVFIAVPALQRNSRNTQRKNDVANLLAAANEVANNNNGTYPTSVSAVTDIAGLGYYNASNVSLGPGSTSSNLTNNLTDQTVRIVTNATCSGANAVVANRQVAVLYAVETPGATNGRTQLCQSS